MSILNYFPKGYTPSDIQADVLRELELRWNSSDIFVLNLDVACHGKGQRVLLSNGQSVAIEDVKVGDKLLGPDGTARKVLETHKGIAPLYDVNCFRYGNYTVTGNHVWPVLFDKRKMTKGKLDCYQEEQEVTTEYLAGKTLGSKSRYYLRSAQAVDYPEKSLPIDPYILGVWLGDGHSGHSSITTMDEEIGDAWYDWTEAQGASIRLAMKTDNRAWTLVSRTDLGKPNPCLNLLKDTNLRNNKHIPEVYFTGSIAQRQELLAGLIDTDGHVSDGIEITQVREKLSKDIQRLAHSLGYSATLSVKTVNGKDYYRVYICGQGVSQLPTRLLRKKPKDTRRQLTNRRFTIKEVGIGEFYGVTVDCDNLYVLEDHTITHNSGKSWIAKCISDWAAAKKKSGTRITTPTSVLVDQYANDFPEVASVKAPHNYYCSTQGFRCPSTQRRRCSSCKYTKDYQAAKKAKISFSTYHMSLAMKKQHKVMIYDEAHKLIPAIREHYANKKWLHKLRIPREVYGDFDLLKDWLKGRAQPEYLSIYRDLTEDMPNHFYTWDTDWWSAGGDIWGVRRRRDEGPVELPTLKIVPADLYDKAPVFWRGDGQKLIFMSATIGRSDLFELGLERHRPVFIEGDSPIPPENRLVIKDYIGSINYNNQDTSVPLLAEKLSTYLREEKGRGIIHLTYSLAEKLKDMLPSGRLITHKQGEVKQALAKYLKTDNAVMIACGMHEGVSLDYEKAQWQAIGKISWPSLHDPLQRYRSQKDPDYYTWSTLKVLIQASGRNCRRPDDRGISYINDASFERILTQGKHLLPKNFKERIIDADTYRTSR